MGPWSRRLVDTAHERIGRLLTYPFGDRPLLDGPYRGPELIYDLAAISERIRRVRLLEARHGCRFMLAVKAIGLPEVLALFARHGVGFDVSNRAEWDAARRAGAECGQLSLTGPRVATVWAGAPLDELQAAHVNVDARAQYDRIPLEAPVTIGIRINASSGTRQGFSRFGVKADDHSTIERIAGDPRFRGIHLHVNNDKHAYPSKVEAALAWLKQTGLAVGQINFGGGLEHFEIDELDALIGDIRRRVGPGIDLIFEPGYFWFRRAGFARARVLSVDPGYLGDGHKITLDLSRVCHLQWTSPVPVLGDAHGPAEKTVFYGPTCVDGDIVTAAALSSRPGGGLEVKPGDVIALQGVGGYAAAWNRGFNGIAPARVTLAGDG